MALSARLDIASRLPHTEPFDWWDHNAPDKPPEPDIAGHTAEEIAALRATHAMKMNAWRAANYHDRIAQWRLQAADAILLNAAVTTVSAVVGGDPATISDPPIAYVPPQGDPP